MDFRQLNTWKKQHRRGIGVPQTQLGQQRGDRDHRPKEIWTAAEFKGEEPDAFPR